MLRSSTDFNVTLIPGAISWLAQVGGTISYYNKSEKTVSMIYQTVCTMRTK